MCMRACMLACLIACPPPPLSTLQSYRAAYTKLQAAKQELQLSRAEPEKRTAALLQAFRDWFQGEGSPGSKSASPAQTPGSSGSEAFVGAAEWSAAPATSRAESEPAPSEAGTPRELSSRGTAASYGERGLRRQHRRKKGPEMAFGRPVGS